MHEGKSQVTVYPAPARDLQHPVFGIPAGKAGIFGCIGNEQRIIRNKFDLYQNGFPRVALNVLQRSVNRRGIDRGHYSVRYT